MPMIRDTKQSQMELRPFPPPPPLFFFFRFGSSAFPDIGSVGRVEKKKKKNIRKGHLVPQHHCFGARKQQVNMAEKLIDVFVKLRQRGEKDQPPKLYVVTFLILVIKRTI